MPVEKSMSSTPLDLKKRIIRAGAGAGKTTDLTATVLFWSLDYYNQNKRWPRIVVTTFTRKATQELKERLQASVLTDKKVHCRLTGRVLSEDDKKLLSEFIFRPSSIHISTIHGVLSKFLKQQGMQLGLPPEISVISEKQNLKNQKRLLKEVIKSEEKYRASFLSLVEMNTIENLISALNSYHEQVLKLGPIDFLSKEELWNSEVLWMQKAFSEYMDIVLSIEDVLTAGTAPNAQILKEYHQRLSSGDYQLDEMLKMVKLDIRAKPKKASPDSERKSKVRGKIVENIEKLILFWDNYEEFQSLQMQFLELATSFHQKFLDFKINSGQLTLNDLELISKFFIERSKEDPELKKAMESFSLEYNFWLVDEFQDTSPLQVEILRGLVGQSSIYIVGDPQQSIYLFRGARSEVFSQKEQEIKSQSGSLESLNKNYRTRPEVLHFINYLFSCVGKQFSSMEVGFSKEIPPRKTPVEIICLPPKNSNKDEDESVDEYEVKVCLSKVQELLSEGVAPESIAILTRTNPQASKIGSAASFLGIPVQVSAAGQFYSRLEVEDALSLLRFIANPSYTKALLQILRGPYFEFSDEKLKEITQDRNISAWQKAKSLFATDPSIRFLNEKLKESLEIGVIAAWERALIEGAYFERQIHADPTGRQEANLWKLLAKVKKAERMPGFNITEFLEEISESDSDVESRSDGDAVPVLEPKRVHIMTIHQSKGLEFENLIVMSCGSAPQSEKLELFNLNEADKKWFLVPNSGDGKYECAYAIQNRHEQNQRVADEFERLLYVAATRAIRSLCFIGEGSRKGSFFDKMNISLDPAEHTIPGGSYVVRTEMSLPEVENSDAVNTVDVKGPWALLDLKGEVTKTSVTELLSDVSRSVWVEKHLKLQSLKRAARGTEIHALLESLKYRKNWSEIKGQNADLDEALEFIETWEGGKIVELIEQGYVEWGFALRKDEGLIQGQIDLWGVDSKGVLWVVDYKTGSSDYYDKAQAQMEEYLRALYKMKKHPEGASACTVALFPFEKKAIVQRY